MKLRIKLHFLRIYRKIMQFKKKEIEKSNRIRLFENCDININYNKNIYSELYDGSVASVNADWKKILKQKNSKLNICNSILKIYQKQNYQLSKFLLKKFSKLGLVIKYHSIQPKELETIKKDNAIHLDEANKL